MTAAKPKHYFLTDLEEAEIQKKIADDLDAPELSNADLSQGRPFRAMFPQLADSIAEEKTRRGRRMVPVPRQQISVRLDPDIIAYYKATGKGWQTRLNNDLRISAGLSGSKP